MKRDDDPYCECGLSLFGLERHERDRHRTRDPHLRRIAEAERDRLREALQEIAERRGLDDGQERDPALIAAAALNQEQS